MKNLPMAPKPIPPKNLNTNSIQKLTEKLLMKMKTAAMKMDEQKTHFLPKRSEMKPPNQAPNIIPKNTILPKAPDSADESSQLARMPGMTKDTRDSSIPSNLKIGST